MEFLAMIFLFGVICGLVMFAAWLEEERDKELTEHTQDIFDRYMRD